MQLLCSLIVLSWVAISGLVVSTPTELESVSRVIEHRPPRLELPLQPVATSESALDLKKRSYLHERGGCCGWSPKRPVASEDYWRWNERMPEAPRKAVMREGHTYFFKALVPATAKMNEQLDEIDGLKRYMDDIGHVYLVCVTVSEGHIHGSSKRGLDVEMAFWDLAIDVKPDSTVKEWTVTPRTDIPWTERQERGVGEKPNRYKYERDFDTSDPDDLDSLRNKMFNRVNDYVLGKEDEDMDEEVTEDGLLQTDWTAPVLNFGMKFNSKRFVEWLIRARYGIPEGSDGSGASTSNS